MFRSLGFAFICALLTSCATAPVPTDTAEVEVRQASDEFWTTRGRGDASALAATFTETAIYGIPGLPDAEGRSAIRALLQKRFESFRITDVQVHRREIDVIGDSAYELGWFSEIHDNETDVTRLDGRYVIVWNRDHDARWRVHRTFYNFSSATPVDAPAN